MIFISGIHGVGKSFFAEKVKEKYGMETYTASALITEYNECRFEVNKQVDNIADNQKILTSVLIEKNPSDKEILLDGHFCLLDMNNKICRIEFSTYIDLAPKAIVLITERINVIAERRDKRDGITIDVDDTIKFQEEEKKYALEVAEKLKIPIFICKGSEDIENAINFIGLISKED